MKYTNKHLKNSYKFNRICLYIGIIGLALSIFILAFGFILSKQQLENISPLEKVFIKHSNPANKTAYIDIIEVPEKISEDKYEIYYLVTTKDDTFISGMQKEQFEELKKDVEENGTARLEGMTKVITDENVKEDVQNHLNEDNIHIRVTKLTYLNILEEGYLVNLILGGIIFLPSIISIIINICALKKYKNSQAKLIDEECNHKDSIWLNDYQIYLTNNFIATTYEGISAIDIKSVKEVHLFDTASANKNIRILEVITTDNTIKIFESNPIVNSIYEADVNYLKDIFDKKNLTFRCDIAIEPEEDYDEDFEQYH